MLHPTLQLQSFSSEFPFSADNALSDELAEKGEKLQRFSSAESFNVTLDVIYFRFSLFSCLHFQNDLLCNRERSIFTDTPEFDTREVRFFKEEAFNYNFRSELMIYGFVIFSLFKSITIDTFYNALENSVENGVDLRAVIEGFIRQKTFSVVFARRQSSHYLRLTKKLIAMPYNLLTSTMNEASEIKWMKNDEFDENIYFPPLAASEWFLLSVDQIGFYRVCYDDDNWRAIISVLRENLDKFSPKTRTQLIDDALNLAKGEFISYNIAFDLLEVFREETLAAPWNAAFQNLLLLNDFLVESRVHREFQVIQFHNLFN